ncbi:MAG TPA: fumarylacetoacetate hydrolase family protein [Hanamia sp.]|nr:fumarylacetoacetate hydrolase family protein [Hanamia sp.]
MKLIRFGKPGNERPGVIIRDKRFDVSLFTKDYDEDFFANNGLEELKKIIEENNLPEIDANERLGCPVYKPSKIICIGLNYAKHAKETNAAVPKEPILFFKSTTAVSGPYDDIIIPKNSTKTDWEVELAVVIAKRASYIDEAEAMDYVAGYCLHNDVSERAFQIERGGQWVKGKSCDTFAPLGPWMATKDEIENVNDLRLWLTVNGEKMQDGNTDDLIFNISQLISYISQFMTLLPGDIISTGTPHGVAMGMNPPLYLKAGDVVELGIDGLGTQKQQVKNWNNRQVSND